MSSIPEVTARQGMFVRNSTGLVRDVSPVSALLFNTLTAVPGLALAFDQAQESLPQTSRRHHEL